MYFKTFLTQFSGNLRCKYACGDFISASLTFPGTFSLRIPLPAQEQHPEKRGAPQNSSYTPQDGQPVKIEVIEYQVQYKKQRPHNRIEPIQCHFP